MIKLGTAYEKDFWVSVETGQIIYINLRLKKYFVNKKLKTKVT